MYGCKKVKEAMEQAPLATVMSRLTRQDNEVMLKLFRTAYCIVKHNFSKCSFPVLITIQECNGLRMGKSYRNDMAASSFISSFSCSKTKLVVLSQENSSPYCWMARLISPLQNRRLCI